ncbi:amidohydrolase [Fusobacterium sp.]|uniref:amidohydrolase n=1 Tax=Fusobacterium sp. TaxID=68766 RepID=UPI0028FF884F|nr:amidohydrolase [Fusobacterium sp.]MDU1910959.1 amidohydrolase [Fusobacterium sp.]
MDMIIFNGKGYTMDNNNSRFTAVSIKDGLIYSVGSNEEILREKTSKTKLIDAQGKMILPGFNDSHMHLLSYGYSLEMVDLNDCKSVNEMKSRIRKYITENKIEKGQWIEGRGWDDNLFLDKKMPSAKDFDEEFKEYYIVLTRTCAQVSVVNTKVLKLAGIFKHPVQIEGGTIEIGCNGDATGILTGLATEIVYKIIPKLTTEQIERAILKASNKYTSSGITSVQTDDFELLRAGTFRDILKVYFKLDRENKLPIRVNLMLHLATLEEIKDFMTLGLKSGDGSPYFKIGPFKTIIDGSLGVRTAALREPYSDNPEDRKNNAGEMYLTKNELRELHNYAFENGFQLVSDAIGDRAMRSILDVYIEILEKNKGKDLRFGIDHCQITTEGIIEDFVKYNIIGGLEFIFLSSDIDMLEDRVGEKRRKESYNFKKFYDLGCVIAAGSDSPVEEYNPLHGIYAAVTRKTYNYLPEGGYNPEQKISVEQGIRAFTTGPAYATFEENKKGSLEVGKYADIVILDEDLYEAEPDHIKDIKILKTIIGGKIVFEAE